MPSQVERLIGGCMGAGREFEHKQRCLRRRSPASSLEDVGGNGV